MVGVVRLLAAQRVAVLVVGGVDVLLRAADAAGGHRREEGAAEQRGVRAAQRARREELRELVGRAELRELGVELRRDDDGALERGVGLHHEPPRGREVPVVRLLDA